MASSKEYLDFVLDQLSGLDGLATRRMMGEYLLYLDGRLVGGIYDDRLLLKPTPGARQMGLPADIPYEGAKPMLLVPDPDNRALLEALIPAMYEELPEPKPRRKRADL